MACFRIGSGVAVVLTMTMMWNWPPSVDGEVMVEPVSFGPLDLAFFMQTEKVSERMRNSIRNVRRFRPEAPFYLLSDGGPDFSEVAAKLGVHAVRAPFRTHLAAYLPPHNFTCRGHLQRLAEAAKWAREQGATYLMIWEEDTRMLRDFGGAPTAEMLTMGNIHNVHAGAWNADEAAALRSRLPPMSLQDERRKRQLDTYAQRRGYSAGPGSAILIDSFLTALERGEELKELDDLYSVQDMCWEDFAISRGLQISRWMEVQQMTHPHPYFLSKNLRCLSCLDSCKTLCVCGPPHTWASKLRYFWNELWAIVSLFRSRASLMVRASLIIQRPCSPCLAGGDQCWFDCQSGCAHVCPAVVHPHKGTTFDCDSQASPRSSDHLRA